MEALLSAVHQHYSGHPAAAAAAADALHDTPAPFAFPYSLLNYAVVSIVLILAFVSNGSFPLLALLRPLLYKLSPRDDDTPELQKPSKHGLNTSFTAPQQRENAHQTKTTPATTTANSNDSSSTPPAPALFPSIAVSDLRPDSPSIKACATDDSFGPAGYSMHNFPAWDSATADFSAADFSAAAAAAAAFDPIAGPAVAAAAPSAAALSNMALLDAAGMLPVWDVMPARFANSALAAHQPSTQSLNSLLTNNLYPAGKALPPQQAQQAQQYQHHQHLRQHQHRQQQHTSPAPPPQQKLPELSEIQLSQPLGSTTHSSPLSRPTPSSPDSTQTYACAPSHPSTTGSLSPPYSVYTSQTSLTNDSMQSPPDLEPSQNAYSSSPDDMQLLSSSLSSAMFNFDDLMPEKFIGTPALPVANSNTTEAFNLDFDFEALSGEMKGHQHMPAQVYVQPNSNNNSDSSLEGLVDFISHNLEGPVPTAGSYAAQPSAPMPAPPVSMPHPLFSAPPPPAAPVQVLPSNEVAKPPMMDTNIPTSYPAMMSLDQLSPPEHHSSPSDGSVSGASPLSSIDGPGSSRSSMSYVQYHALPPVSMPPALEGGMLMSISPMPSYAHVHDHGMMAVDMPKSQRGRSVESHAGSKEYPFVCPHCSGAFRIRGYLTRHMKKHAINKAYQCPFYNCEEKTPCHPTGGFSRRDTYKTHLKARHFLYPPGTRSENRAKAKGMCRGCGAKFESNERWVEEHIHSRQCPGLVPVFLQD